MLLSSFVLLAAAAEKVFFYPPCVTPNPEVQNCTADVAVYLNNETKFQLVCPDPEAKAWVKGKLKPWFMIEPAVSQQQETPASVTHNDGYELEATPGKIVMRAKTLQGIRYAMYTLRQSAERQFGGEKTHGYWMAQLKVKDAPKPGIEERWLQLCTGGRRTVTQTEKLIRLAAYYKYNYLLLGGESFVSSRYPWLNAADAKITPEIARHLVAVGKDLGITIVPCISVFGHAPGSSDTAGTSNGIDLHPENQPIFEPDGGFNFCLSNPDARRICREWALEVYEAFGRPPYMHIGADELNAPTCAKCRAVNYAELVGRQITEVAAELRKRGARTMLWHDWLLERDDPRWKPLFYTGAPKGMDKVLKTLPKDLIVCDWYYGNYAVGGKTDPGGYPTLDYFKSLGFDTITCPYHDMPGYKLQSAYARKIGLKGVMATTWNDGNLLLMNVIQGAANDIWGANSVKRTGPIQSGNCWRQMGWDMGVANPKERGFPDRCWTKKVD